MIYVLSVIEVLLFIVLLTRNESGIGSASVGLYNDKTLSDQPSVMF